ncbi:MAG TPA: YibE/F family protein [Anaerolineae bacterium]|nr:YibE/F family protein [Anaerolineae bacterium]
MRIDRIRLSLIAVAVVLVGGLAAIGRSAHSPLSSTPIGAEETVQARVIEVIDEGVLDQGGIQQPYQQLRLEILEGELAGRAVVVEHGRYSLLGPEALYRAEERVMVLRTQRPDLGDVFIITDAVRLDALALLSLAFVVFILLVARKQGVRSLLGMFVSLVIITQFILPMILAGNDPVLVSIVGAFVQLAVTLYLIYGWTRKTHAAVSGMLFSLIVTGLLAAFFMNLTRLTGQGAEESLFLQASGAQINLRGLLLGGIIIGALGVLDDITISQASAVTELTQANPTLAPLEVYRRAMNIGRDHIASTVNTLVLAYVGASLPLLLLFSIYPQPFGQVVNREFIAEEIVRTLVGSLGLMASVPITTFLASVVFRGSVEESEVSAPMQAHRR